MSRGKRTGTHPPTSVDAKHQVEDAGRLWRDRVAVGREFYRRSGTSREVLTREVMLAAGLEPNLNVQRARITELLELGLLVITSKRPCAISGRKVRVHEWRPSKPPEKAFQVEFTVDHVEAVRLVREGKHPLGFLALTGVLTEILDQTSTTMRLRAALLKQRESIRLAVECGSPDTDGVNAASHSPGLAEMLRQ